ncbi:response regulator transcription factor [Lysobacter sp. A6]|uniref:Response regulator transcription factor n=1 Tax=Noviluteimonas lactosilytica TaxID=2888523 RepID=A0ABS8JD70_9GAMM|nr:response regulator transcription factor [Lysobacter lactosilyticus]MCC8361542.1 response regulator transcription factor [Lysobacter lactosilyticus]
MERKPRLLLAEDSPVMARQLRLLLAQDYVVVGLVTDGESILSALESLAPDVLVTDISMPGIDGLAAAEQALRTYPDLRVVFITVHDEPSLVARARALPRTAYVLKADAGDALPAALDAVLAGRWYASASITREKVRK